MTKPHDFRLGGRLVELDVPDQWHRREARCLLCGEEREVYHAVPARFLNLGPCVGRVRRFIRLLGYTR